MPEQDDEFAEIHVERLSDRASKAAARRRMQDVDAHIDEVVRDATTRGQFEDLPGAGKPIEDLGTEHDPDWWIKRLVEREQIVVLPPSVQLRKDDAELDDLLDKQATEQGVREVVEDFNSRVIAARYGIPQGPPLITMPRDVEETVAHWRERRQARIDDVRRWQTAPEKPPRKRRWWRRSA